MGVTLGLWVIPLAITIAMLIYGLLPVCPDCYGSPITEAFWMMGLIILNLAAWLIWAVIP